MKAVKLFVCALLVISFVLQISCAGADGGVSSAESSAAAHGTAGADEKSGPVPGGVSEESEMSEENPVPAFALTNEAIEDKIKGSWAAQMIGVAWGASTEFQYQGVIMPEDKVPVWNARMINDAFGQDDLYVEIPYLDTMYKNGPGCELSLLAEALRTSAFPLDHANKQGRANLRAGIPAPQSGSYLYNYHCDDIDWQIEADFLGNLYPGLVDKAAERAFEIGHITNYGDGVYGGVYIAVMHAAAFTAESVYEIAESGRKAIPEGTKFRAVIDEVDECYKNGLTWQECWQKIQDDWAHTARCVSWLGMAANIDAKINAAYIHIGLLWGGGDFAETVKISMRCGQDSDCNPSSAAGVLGAFYGFSMLNAEYTSALDNDAVFSATDYSFGSCVSVSCDLAKKALEESGAVYDGSAWLVPVKETETYAENGLVPYEQWPSDAVCAYLHVSEGMHGRVSLGTAFSLPEGYDGEVTQTLDMGDGTVVGAAIGAYRYVEDGDYDITYTVKAGDTESTSVVSITVNGADPNGRGFSVTPSCSAKSPTGGGNKNIRVITDENVPDPYTGTAAEQYDTFTGSNSDLEWFALEFDHSVLVTAAVFTEGMHFSNGGWFDTAPQVQVLKDGEWTGVQTSSDIPYGGHDSFATFTFTLASPEWCEGVRVAGRPGGSASFVSCAELDVLFGEVKDPTYEQPDPDSVQDAAIIVSVTDPRGTGCKDIEIIRDGHIPTASENYVNVSYDTFAYNAEDHEEYVGYVFYRKKTLSAVTFTEGAHFNDGGYFKDGSIRVEILVDGEWRAAEAVPDKPYPTGNTQGAFGANYESYRFVFASPVECGGVRIIGSAGGSMHFISVSELSVETDKAGE